ncbi:hypothetical protein UlMin_019602 [Ulmus minor]
MSRPAQIARKIQREWCCQRSYNFLQATYSMEGQLVHGLTVILTSRDPNVGVEAAKVLQEGGFNVAFHLLDVLDTFLSTTLLIGFTKTMAVWIFCFAPVKQIMITGQRIGDLDLRRELSDVDSHSEELIDHNISSFLQQVEEGTWESGGWPQTFTDCSISKLTVNAYTRLMVKTLSDTPEGHKIYINCFCPGSVKTYARNIPAEEVADTGVWLALLPDLSVTGIFFAERCEINF